MNPALPQRRLHINGFEMNLVDAGQGEPVLLVHGFPDDHTVWREQIPALLAAGYRVIAPDLRGCGDSAAPRGRRAYRIATLIDDLTGLLDHLGIDRVRLLAHDWGAVIGWRLCIDRPERVERYMALSVGHPIAYARAPWEQKRKGWYVLFFQLAGIAEWLLRLNRWWLFKRLTRYAPEFERWIARLGRPGRLTAALNYYRANLGLLWPAPSPPSPVPVLGVWSDGDRFLCEAQMRDSAKLVAGPFRYQRIDGAGHWLQLECPERVNRLLLDFLAEPAVADNPVSQSMAQSHA